MTVELLPYKNSIKQMTNTACEPFLYLANLIDSSCFDNILSVEQKNKGEICLLKPEMLQKLFRKDYIKIYRYTPFKWINRKKLTKV